MVRAAEEGLALTRCENHVVAAELTPPSLFELGPPPCRVQKRFLGGPSDKSRHHALTGANLGNLLTALPQ